MQEIQIVDYEDHYHQAFKSLNAHWITKYFEMEPADYQVLDHPRENVLDKGGYIAVALWSEAPVGVCALLKMENGPFDYELAKMGVSPKARGKGVGYALGQAIIEKAKTFEAKNIYLESNTLLKPAIGLYRKLGFVEIEGIVAPYKRCNIQMVLALGAP